MLRAPAVLFALLIFLIPATVVASAVQANPATQPQSEIRSSQPTPQANSAAGDSLVQSRFSEDPAAEDELLNLANRSREQAGVQVLRGDAMLREAARQHALRVVESEQLEHQFPGEFPLLERIALVSPPEHSGDKLTSEVLRVDRAGENLAYSNCSSAAHDALMRSVPHRENLLNREFTLAGIAAFWRDGKLYVVEDFAREIPSYSAEQNRSNVSQAIQEFRQGVGLSELKPVANLNQPELAKLDQAACSLAHEGGRPNARLLTAAYNEHAFNGQSVGSRRIVAYTQSDPSMMPKGALKMFGNPELKQFVVGSCFARNATYPTGTYWIAILLY